MTNSKLCPYCIRLSESPLHMVRDCDEAADLWLSMINMKNWQRFFFGNLQDWILWNLSQNAGRWLGIRSELSLDMSTR